MAHATGKALTIALALALAACGRKGPLDVPGQPAADGKPTPAAKPKTPDTDPNSPDRVLQTPRLP